MGMTKPLVLSVVWAEYENALPALLREVARIFEYTYWLVNILGQVNIYYRKSIRIRLTRWRM